MDVGFWLQFNLGWGRGCDEFVKNGCGVWHQIIVGWCVKMSGRGCDEFAEHGCGIAEIGIRCNGGVQWGL